MMYTLLGIWAWVLIGVFLAGSKFNECDNISAVKLRCIIIFPPLYWLC